MFIARKVRPLVCLLLAVSTAIGVVVPARACACAMPAKTPPTPVAVGGPTAKSCCPLAKKQSCCATAPTGHAAKASCCGEKSPTDAPSGCHALRCDCDAPAVPPAPATPVPPSSPDLNDHVTVSPVPSVVIPAMPAAGSHTTRSASTVPPTDLVISLSRRTC